MKISGPMRILDVESPGPSRARPAPVYVQGGPDVFFLAQCFFGGLGCPTIKTLLKPIKTLLKPIKT